MPTKNNEGCHRGTPNPLSVTVTITYLTPPLEDKEKRGHALRKPGGTPSGDFLSLKPRWACDPVTRQPQIGSIALFEVSGDKIQKLMADWVEAISSRSSFEVLPKQGHGRSPETPHPEGGPA